MENVAVAKQNHIRISASKVKIVIDLIRNKPVTVALAILRATPKAASEPVEKLLLSAAANAENNHNMNVDALYVAEIFANQGPTMKRIQPRAQGRAFRILKRTSHLTIILKEKETAAVPAGKEKKSAKPDKKAAKAAAPKKEADLKEASKPKAKKAVKEGASKEAAPKKTASAGARKAKPAAKEAAKDAAGDKAGGAEQGNPKNTAEDSAVL